MVDAENVIFNRAVNFFLHRAIPTHVDRSGEYELGDVLVFEKKLRPLMPWRKHRLVFTGINISKLLTEPVDVTSDVEQIFDVANTSRSFGENVKVDGEIQYAMAHFGVDISETEKASMSVDFGKIERHYSNLPQLLGKQAEKRMYVSTTHPVIQDAMANNKTLFIINSLYVAEKAIINLSFSDGSKDDAADKQQARTQPTAPSQSTTTTAPSSGTTTTTTSGTTTTTTDPSSSTTGTTSDPSASTPAPTTAVVESSGADVGVSFSSTGKSVIERHEQTNIAYRVMRIKLGSHGALLPQLRAAIRHIKVRVIDETDFGPDSNFVDAKISDDQCDFTHDLFDIMAAREDET